MDAFSSSFLTLIPQPNLLLSQTKPSLLPTQFRIVSSQTSTTIPYRQPKSQKIVSNSKPFPSVLLDALENTINNFIDPPTSPSVDPKLVFSGNFAPVEELPPTECEVDEGTLPSCLNGAYIRNGPNPQFSQHGPCHFFDGGGMLHSIRISNQKATFCSRFIKTYKYMVEHEAGSNIIPNLLGGFNGFIGFAARAILTAIKSTIWKYDRSNGIGLANTSLALFGNRLYALCESDLPYEVSLTPNGDVQTLGRSNFDGKLFIRMTAHPKIDPDTGEAFAFSYRLVSPFLTYFRFDSKGNKHKDVPILSMLQPSYLHDFAITSKFAIFPDIQIQMDPMKMILSGGSPLRVDLEKVSRLGVAPKYASDEKDMRWFEVPRLNLLHAINAWDEVNENGTATITMVVTNSLSPENTLDRPNLVHVLIEKITIDLEMGLVSREPLSRRNLDLAVINPAYVGKKNKYVYAGIGYPLPKLSGILKLDVSMTTGDQECIAASRMFGPGCYGGEPFFVARDPDDLGAEEDDGYLVTFIHDEKTRQSRFIVMDAKSSSLDIVASVKLPQRVPYGIHGLFVKDKDLQTLYTIREDNIILGH